MSGHSQWKTSTGFILASAGSAIGLGAMWKFPYMAGIYGGGAFLLMFLIFTIFVGLPLLIMEFTVGKMGRTYTTQIYKKLTGKKWLNIIGWNGNLAVFILFGFYSVMLTSTVLGLITMILFKPRSWCVYCPMGTMTQMICKAKSKSI